VLGGFFLLFCVFIGVVYASTEVPTLDSVQTNQKTIVYYSDGVTEMARLGDENRTNVSIDQISEPAREAVLAAENRNFYSDPGISFSGIVRATWNNLTGGSQQGGSTITQQYVGLAFLNNGNSYKEKFQELFLAVKLDNSVSKDDILESYLNTIYFGRGAYGIEAAAQTYFNVPASQLTAEQGAVLAVLIRNPSFYDPETNLEGASDRWGLVLDGMVGEGWLTSEQRAAAVYPPINPKGTTNQIGFPEGPEGLIVGQVQQELTRLYQFDDQQINSGGLRVVTTIDANRQRAAVETVNDVLTGESVDLRQSLVSIDPRTGAVVAYYGGPNGSGTDYAQVRRQPGSSMKPYVLATALGQGISVNARRDGSSPQTFPDRRAPVTNSGNAQCASCTLVQAMTRSLNTTFYGLAYEVGPENVRSTALAATGMPETWPATGNPIFDDKKTLANADGATGSAIGIGEYEMRPIDQAVGFATFANNGIRHSPFFVSRVTSSEGTVLRENAGDAGEQVIPADIANDVTFALEGVAAYSKRSLDGNRPVASKTGTQGLDNVNNSDAWMVGYTPSLSTAVWMGSDARLPIINSSGSIIYGSGLPGAIWQDYMDLALDGTPVEPLPEAAIIRGDSGVGVPEPTTSAPTTSRPAPTTTSAPEPTTESPEPTTEAPETTVPTTTTPAPPTTQAPASGRPSAEPVPSGGAGRPTGTNGSRAPVTVALPTAGAQPTGVARPTASARPTGSSAQPSGSSSAPSR
jgi:membrane peptidoglycan carboxypeptidase